MLKAEGNTLSLALPLAQIFILIGLGFSLRFLKYNRLTGIISNSIIYVTLPCITLVNISRLRPEQMQSMMYVALAAASITFTCLILSLLYAHSYVQDPRTKGSVVFTSTFHNSLNLPFPLILALYGELSAAIVYTTTVSIIQITLAPIIGSYFMNREKPYGNVNPVRNLLTFPPFLALLISVLFILINFQVPSIPFETIGIGTVYLGLTLLGLTLPTTLSLKPYTKEITFTGLMCFIISPIIGGLIIGLGGLHGVVRGTILIESLMPPAVMDIVYITKYRLNKDEGARATLSLFILSILMVITIYIILGS